MEKIVIIGYSGHSYGVIDILRQRGYSIAGYIDRVEKAINPYTIKFIGSENDPDSIKVLQESLFIVTIGDCKVRSNIYRTLIKCNYSSLNAIHPNSNICINVSIGSGNMIMAGVVINAFSKIGNAVIINSGAIVEHECTIGDYSHIAPGAVLAGNVNVGVRSFIGANSVIKEGVKIGDDVIIGAGSVVIRDVLCGEKVAGNPARKILYEKK